MHADIMRHLAMQAASYIDDFYKLLALCLTSGRSDTGYVMLRTSRKEPLP
jgi:hypothetical protein